MSGDYNFEENELDDDPDSVPPECGFEWKTHEIDHSNHRCCLPYYHNVFRGHECACGEGN